MGARRLDDEGLACLASATADRDVVERWRAKIVTVEGSGCLWWTGAISGRGHGRFWYAPGRVVIAHRFAFALAHDVTALAGAELLGHRCDNPLCQRVHPEHVVRSTYVANRLEWAIRKKLTGSPLGDPRGSRRRARELRDLAREDPALLAADQAALLALYGEQLPLW